LNIGIFFEAAKYWCWCSGGRPEAGHGGSLSHLPANQRAKISGILWRDWLADQFLCLEARLQLGRTNMISLCSLWESTVFGLNAHSTSPTNRSPTSDLPGAIACRVQRRISSNIICLASGRLSHDASTRTGFPGANKGNLNDLKRGLKRHTPLGVEGRESSH